MIRSARSVLGHGLLLRRLPCTVLVASSVLALCRCGGDPFTVADDAGSGPIYLDPPEAQATTDAADGGASAPDGADGGQGGDASVLDAADATEGGDDATMGAETSSDAASDSALATVVDAAGDSMAMSMPDASGVVCDGTADPMTASCTIDDRYAVFVSTSGSDGGSGRSTDPVRTIGEGIAAAIAQQKGRVYVCRGTYAEQVVLDAQHDGVSVYGGFSCSASWAWTGDKPEVTGPSSLYALDVNGTTKAIAIDDMAFSVPKAMGQDATGAGNSSVAARVTNATGMVTLTRVALHAGAGADGGAGGTPPTNWFSSNPADLGGTNVLQFSPAKMCSCMASSDSSTGGASGSGSVLFGQGGTSNPAATPDSAHPGDNGAGGFGAAGDFCGSGRNGANGQASSTGGSASSTLGTTSHSTWTPAAGLPGLRGFPGQGGGGGGFADDASMGGAAGVAGDGGACGGCGGSGGLPGGGGGGSVALLAVASPVTLRAVALFTGAGGAGGAGGSGENGEGGGIGGSVGVCSGGNGGNGAGGAGGGGGSGGVSIGVLSTQGSVTTDTATAFTIGLNGPGGAGGDGGLGGSTGSFPAPTGLAGARGIDGVAQAMLAL